MAGHVSLELAAGVGLPLASLVGPVPAAAAFAVCTRAVWRRAGDTSAPVDGRLGFWNGLSLAAAIAHLRSWPRRRSRTGLPLLVECEGLAERLMPAYNALIYVGAGSAVVALIREDRSGPRWPALVGISATPLLAVVQPR